MGGADRLGLPAEGVDHVEVPAVAVGVAEDLLAVGEGALQYFGSGQNVLSFCENFLRLEDSKQWCNGDLQSRI